MRTFYIFKINDHFKNLTQSNSYNLFKTIENIYHLKKEDYAIGITLFEQIAEFMDYQATNNYLLNANRFNEFYTKYSNIHMINNYYSDERSKLVVNKTYLLLKSTKQYPSFLKELTFDENLFACDFQNQDYFWLESLT